MLRALRIKNLAIIDVLDLEFGPGFSVLSGETGAGKSILIDALGLVLGDRADATLVRAGEAQAPLQADISAEFSLDASLSARSWLREQAMEDADNPDTCLLRRVVTGDGRSRAFINGATASLANLRELGERLVEIHGQNEHQSLLRAETQRDLLDDFGAYPTALTAVIEAARQYAEAESAIEKLRAAASRDPAQLDYLRHQIKELESLKLQDGELPQLDSDHKRLANAGRLMEEGGQAQELLYGGENSLHDQLAAVRNLLAGLAALDPAFGASESLLAEAQVQIREAADGVQRTLDRLDLDPDRLAEVEQRLEAIHDLARKHRVKPEELGARLESLISDLQSTEQSADALLKLESQRATALKSYQTAAQALTALRKKAAKDLAAKVCTLIRELGMPKSAFQVVLESRPQERPRPAGDDEIRFDFTANPGQPPRPLSKVASGGELSRVSLAIQLAANQSRAAGTLIFDEVDAGVGGGTAEIVGLKLRQLAGKRQVLSVTHLPQVAAQGEHHYAIEKEIRAGKTLTCVKRLDARSRVAELARMLGGREITASTQAHAQDMLARAKKTG
jgi:DNA repair protein RecN (Recombination protein N)